MLTVTLSAAPNPDYPPNDERGSIRLRKRTVPVASLRDASKACRDFILTHNLGGGNWTGGEVRDASKAFVARISYNGRAWTKDNVEIPF